MEGGLGFGRDVSALGIFVSGKAVSGANEKASRVQRT